jgi:DNA-binding MarR family transcriptional regulator
VIAPAPVPTLVSQLLVAFTMEFDNAAEPLIPHRTARGPAAGRKGGVWLVSQAMWANCLRFLDGRDVPFADLAGPAGMTNFAGLLRWGYVRVGSSPDRMVGLTAAGKAAADVFRALAGEIEDRWTRRFGTAEVGALRSALVTVLDKADEALPRYLPVTAVQEPRPVVRWAEAREDPAGLDLSALLAQALMLVTDEYDRAGRLPLPIAANALRVVPPGRSALPGSGAGVPLRDLPGSGAGVPLRDLPRLAGVAREQIDASVKLLERRELLVLEPDPGGRGKRVVLTGRGAAAQRHHHELIERVDGTWRERFGPDAVAALTAIRDQTEALAAGLTPPPEGWRAHPPYASLTKALLADPAASLPHYPMVSHRGGYPDGS